MSDESRYYVDDEFVVDRKTSGIKYDDMRGRAGEIVAELLNYVDVMEAAVKEAKAAEGWRGGVRICSICIQPITGHDPNCTEDVWADYMKLTARLREKYRIGIRPEPPHAPMA